MAIRVAVVNSLGITNAAWRIQNETIREDSVTGSITSEFEFLAPDESQFTVLQSDLSRLSASLSAQTMKVYMQDGTQLSLQGSLVMSMNGVPESSTENGGGSTVLDVVMGVIGGAAGVAGAYYLVKKIYFPTSFSSNRNAYVV